MPRFSSKVKPATPSPLTPYAVLGVGPRTLDADIRRRYYELVTPHHPDKRKDKLPGPLWEQLTSAYRKVDNVAHREQWMKFTTLLSGGCRECKRYGVTPNGVKCAACGGAGRVV